ncbi:uncharacterized protein LOC143468498 isoform X2 [Clavelina lepadiformis]|uniref:uncharacterized protein LOC143468498 isoform X2 n=1 Tax=Clavelina lepadiformis TaxID=159417 RepID=UPI0040412C9C
MKSLDMTIFLVLLLGVFTLFSDGQSVSDGNRTQKFGNGCLLTNTVVDDVPFKSDVYKMSPPHLDCAGRNLTRFQVSGDIGHVKTLTLFRNRLLQLHVDDFAGFVNLSYMEVMSNKVQRIVASSKGLVLPSVTFISLFDNKLSVVPTGGLKSFPNLEVLVLSRNFITSISKDDFRFTPNLLNLGLQNNPLRNFEAGWLSNLHLDELGLKSCNLTKVPIGIANSSTLSGLDLSRNLITELKNGSFKGNSQLRRLLVSSNKIFSVESAAFDGASSLRRLDLSDNLIESLRAGTFTKLGKPLLKINLYENPLNCNCSLRWLKQFENELVGRDIPNEIRYKCQQPLRNHNKKSHEIKTESFSCESDDQSWTDCNEVATTTRSPTTTAASTNTNTSLCPRTCVCYDKHFKQYYPPPGTAKKNKRNYWSSWIGWSTPRVRCEEAKLKEIPIDDIRSDVAMISLAANNIPLLDLSRLKNFTKLKTLNLQNNGIQSVKPAPDITFKSVTYLVLQYNKIRVITSEHLKSFPSLTYIGLQHNLIINIPSDLFQHNGKLTYLYLGPNPVKSFNEDFMQNLSLRSVYLRNMSLFSVPSSIGKLVNMTSADLSDNYITTVNDSAFSNCKNLMWLYLHNNRISSIAPDAFNGAAKLSRLTLSANKLTTIPGNVFSNIGQERLNVELWENQLVCDCKMKPFMTWLENRTEADPTTEFRFRCYQPLRLHHAYVDTLLPNDFICDSSDKMFTLNVSTYSNPSGRIALSVILSVIGTLLCTLFVYRWRNSSRRHTRQRIF